SKRVIEKCGFRYEGTLRQAERIYDGKVYDHLCYSLTRKEYQKESGYFESAEREEAMDKISFAQVARPDQIRDIVEMAGRIWHQHYDSLLPAGQVDYMLEKYQSDAAIRKQLIDGDIYFLMEYEGWSVGYSSVKVDEGTLFISKVYIYKDWRGKKLFSALLDMYEHYCRANGLAMMWLSVNRNNKESIAIYEHMGFVKEKKQITDIGNGYVMDDYIMVKRLNEGV
ncbi:MAG: GNAT family N-acetyltransferase, partial [Syntrophomonadaceae bacterium]|nr:GNAT family N-acetyltransferase [Syntrophomonadaceae bacterium]